MWPMKEKVTVIDDAQLLLENMLSPNLLFDSIGIYSRITNIRRKNCQSN